LEHIFDDFGQTTYEKLSFVCGTGLVLPLLKKLVEQQGGTVHVESKLGKDLPLVFN
jgi:signal transduction histidine kinase